MPNTYTLISSNTVGSSGASTVTFSSIPATYTDLLVKVSSRVDYAATSQALLMRFNSSATSYTGKLLRGSGSAASSFASGTTYINLGETVGATSTTNTFGNTEIYIPNYTGSNYKSTSSDGTMETNGATSYMELTSGLWSDTAAITSISFSASNSSNFVQYSTFYLYGINKS